MRACADALDSLELEPRLAVAARRLVAAAAASDDDEGVEYARLLLVGRPVTAHPYESFYRANRLHDPPTLEAIGALCAGAGVHPRLEPPLAVDHIAVELELLALLLRGLGDPVAGAAAGEEIAGLARQLLDQHLTPFAAAFVARLETAGPCATFAAAGELLDAVLAAASTVVQMRGSTHHPRSIEPQKRQKEERHMQRITTVLAGLLLGPALALGQTAAPEDAAGALRKDIEDLEARLEKVEKKAAKDRINFSGDFRFEAHSIQADIPDHYDGMVLQNGIVNTLFYYGATGQLPQGPAAVNQFIAQHYGDYLYFTDHLTFAQLKQSMAMFPPQMQQGLMMMLLPGAYAKGTNADNSLMYTSRLRFGFDAEVASNVKFTGRLAMYKTWGDSTGVQVFNGQSNSFNIDGNTSSVPNSDILRVERAYFDWTNIGGSRLYLSIGRRPSTGGPPMNVRQGELRGGSPMGAMIDFQFDGITLGYHLGEVSTVRLCYGRGYESGFGNGSQLQQPADRLKDADFAGLNWDLYATDDMLAQITVARAFNLTDGFNGLIVLPTNPLTGAQVGAPVVMRFTPSANLGDMDIAGLVFQRHDGPFDYFVNVDYVKSHPDNVTTPFGGLFADPFDVPRSQSGNMVYVGGRYTFNNESTMVGLEYNRGSKYWFNFTPAQDDIIAPKTNTRGRVFEAYLIHKINARFSARLSYIDYQYDYSGSGWQLGAPKKLDSTPILGFPTYEKAKKIGFSMTAKF